MLIGQFAKSGPLDIWRYFPLARGVGVAWLILILVDTCFNILEASKVLAYLYQVSHMSFENTVVFESN